MFHLLDKPKQDYRYYRWFFTTSGILVVGGKSDEQNELVLHTFLKPTYTVVHTTAPGSPFMIIQSESPTQKDITEAAVFCACFSKQWKQLKNIKGTISIDIFKGEHMYKLRGMKKGTFGVKGQKKTILVSPSLLLLFQKGKLRAVPPNARKKRVEGEILATITTGKMNKEEAASYIAKKIKETFHFPISKEEIVSAIPSDKLHVE